MQRKITPLSHPFHAFTLNVKLLTISVLILLSSASLRAFHIECPPDVTVHCTDEIWDLSVYGTALIYGYGAPQPAGPPTSVHYNLNNCNVGTIIRTWVAYDYGGYPHSCSQKITVTGTGGSVHISWPPDYTIHSCYPSIDPDNLPPPYNRPVIHGGGGCTQILYSHSDKVFNINPPACKKILRTWTVIDWCSYDPHAYYPTGIWEYIQIIKITPSSPPQIWCPGDTIVSAGADCTGGHVILPPAFGTSDCGASVHITNNSPYAFSNGPNASGNYPIGTTKVTFWADDGCGQKTSCSMYITVKDMKKPTPICYYGVSLTLMQMPDGYYLDLRPQFFNKGSFDNCTPKHKLEMWVEPSRVSCDELGETAVRMYVRDESGNIEYCNTIVYVQDNLGICPPKDGLVDGTVQTLTGELVSDVKVMLDGTTDFSMTDDEGYYAFPALKYGKSYTIKPTRPQDNLADINTIDLSVLLKHLMGVERIESPYRLIAADLDRSGRVGVNDLLALRELIVMELYGLEPTTSWRFVDAAYNFENPHDPFIESFPESYAIQKLESTVNGLDFVAIKLGDINGDAAGNNLSEPIISRSPGVPVFIADRSYKRGEVFEIALSTQTFAEMTALQFSMRIDPGMLEIISYQSVDTRPGLDVMTSGDNRGMLSVLFYGMDALRMPELVKVKLRGLQDGVLSKSIELISGGRSLAYRVGQKEPSNVLLSFESTHAETTENRDDGDRDMIVGQNYPNPFSGRTYIPVQLREKTDIRIKIVDISGRTVQTFMYPGVEGYQEIPIDLDISGSELVLICRLTTHRCSRAIKMLTGIHD